VNRFFEWSPYKDAPFYRHSLFPVAAIREHLQKHGNGLDEVKSAIQISTDLGIEILAVEENGKMAAVRKEIFSDNWLYNNLRYFRKSDEKYTGKELYASSKDNSAIPVELFMAAYIMAMPALEENTHPHIVSGLADEYAGKRSREFDGPRLAAAIIVEGACYADGVFGEISADVWMRLDKVNKSLYTAARKKIEKWHNEGYDNLLPPGYERMF
jgi:hypothetical protein